VAMGAGRNSQKKRTVGKAVKPEAGCRGCAVPPRPTPPCISGSFSEAFPEAPFCGFGSTWSAAFLTAELRRVIFLCVTLRRALRNSAVKRTQTHLQPSKVFWIYPWCQARPADPGRCVSTPAGRLRDPRSASCTGSCHMKICLG
jgi:hypothetical protein